MKKEFKSMFVIGNVVCLLLFTACGGKDSSKSSNKVKAVNDNASALYLVSGNYTADSESSSVLWECGWLGGNSHNGDVYLEEGLLSIKDNNNLTGSFLVDMTTIDCHDEKNIGTKNKIIGHLKSDDFFDVGRKIASINLPTLFVMEGGYAIKEIGVNTVNTLKGFENG